MTDESHTSDTTTNSDRTDRAGDAAERATPLESLTDPERLIDRSDVEFHEKPSVEHQHHFDLYEPIDGMAVVGATNADGEVLLLVDRSAGHAVLPYGRVSAGEGWAALARRRTEELTDVVVSIDGVERVRRKRYRPEGDERETTGYDVVLRASPADGPVTGEVGTCEENDWEAEWVGELPADVDAEGDVLDDIRLFVD